MLVFFIFLLISFNAFADEPVETYTHTPGTEQAVFVRRTDNLTLDELKQNRIEIARRVAYRRITKGSGMPNSSSYPLAVRLKIAAFNNAVGASNPVSPVDQILQNRKSEVSTFLTAMGDRLTEIENNINAAATKAEVYAVQIDFHDIVY